MKIAVWSWSIMAAITNMIVVVELSIGDYDKAKGLMFPAFIATGLAVVYHICMSSDENIQLGESTADDESENERRNHE